MIKAEILTARSRYLLELPDLDDTYEAYNQVAQTLETTGIFFEPNGVLYIPREGNIIHSIRVWEEVDWAAELLAPDYGNPVQGDGGGGSAPWKWRQEGLEYLGQKLTLEGFGYIERGSLFYLPMYINQALALDMLAPDKVTELTEEYLQSWGIKGEIVLPPVPILDEQEAQAYLMDYAEEAAPDAPLTEEVTGRALRGVFEG